VGAWPSLVARRGHLAVGAFATSHERRPATIATQGAVYS
jgi:hypothetical protein